jgi:hypothetical protein
LDRFTEEAFDSLSQLCEKLGRHEEAERLKRELQDLRLVGADSQSTETCSIPEKDEDDTSQPEAPSHSEDAVAPDPGGDPTYYPPSRILSPITRLQRPFIMRPAFCVSPNSWSMF